ncbi:MAG: hypothetical protein EBZ51_07735, partial [Synechococcaceae bacterium WB9_2_112]|nr:hypothetical protein [Synechococcaceae bacterium WB9_2_112]
MIWEAWREKRIDGGRYKEASLTSRLQQLRTWALDGTVPSDRELPWNITQEDLHRAATGTRKVYLEHPALQALGGYRDHVFAFPPGAEGKGKRRSQDP